MKKHLLLSAAFLMHSLASFAQMNAYCTKSSDSFLGIVVRHEIWFKKIKEKKTDEIPSIIFDRDIFLKSQLNVYGNYLREHIATKYTKGYCQLYVRIYSESDQSKNVLIKKGAVLKYGKEINDIKIDSNRSLILRTNTNLVIEFELATDWDSCKGDDLSLAANKLGFTFNFAHAADAKECIPPKQETEVISVLENKEDSTSSQSSAM